MRRMVDPRSAWRLVFIARVLLGGCVSLHMRSVPVVSRQMSCLQVSSAGEEEVDEAEVDLGVEEAIVCVCEVGSFVSCCG